MASDVRILGLLLVSLTEVEGELSHYQISVCFRFLSGRSFLPRLSGTVYPNHRESTLSRTRVGCVVVRAGVQVPSFFVQTTMERVVLASSRLLLYRTQIHGPIHGLRGSAQEVVAC